MVLLQPVVAGAPSCDANLPARRWSDVPAVVLCLVASRAAQPPAPQSTREGSAALGQLRHDEGPGAPPGSLGPSRAALSALRLVCKAWRSAIDTSLEWLTLYRCAAGGGGCCARRPAAAASRLRSHVPTVAAAAWLQVAAVRHARGGTLPLRHARGPGLAGRAPLRAGPAGAAAAAAGGPAEPQRPGAGAGGCRHLAVLPRWAHHTPRPPLLGQEPTGPVGWVWAPTCAPSRPLTPPPPPLSGSPTHTQDLLQVRTVGSSDALHRVNPHGGHFKYPETRRLPPALAQLPQLRRLCVVSRTTTGTPSLVLSPAGGSASAAVQLDLPALQELQLLAPAGAVEASLGSLAARSLQGVTALQVAVTDKQPTGVGGRCLRGAPAFWAPRRLRARCRPTRSTDPAMTLLTAQLPRRAPPCRARRASCPPHWGAACRSTCNS
jgi:hypothetical protein